MDYFASLIFVKPCRMFRTWGYNVGFFDMLFGNANSAINLNALDEKHGFRDLKFGDPLGDGFEQIGAMGDAGMVLYVRRSDSLRIGEADMESIHYTFYRGRFYSVTLTPANKTEFVRLGEVFIKAYGRPIHDDSDPSNEYFVWNAVKTMLFQSWDNYEGKGFALINSKLIEQEAKRDREADARRGIEDL